MDFRRAVDLIFNPDAFFSRLVASNTDLLIPSVIVGMIGAANVISSFLSGTYGYHPFLKALLFSDNTLLVIVLPFLGWILVSALLFTIGRWISGTGSIRTTLLCSGDGFLPLALLSIVYHISVITVIPATSTHFQEGLQAIFFLFIFAIVCFFRTGYLLVYGVKNAHDLIVAKAFNAVVIMLILAACLLLCLEFVSLQYHTMISGESSFHD